MIWIIQEFYDGKWWHVSFHTQEYYAKEQLKYIQKTDEYGAYRIMEFEVPEEIE